MKTKVKKVLFGITGLTLGGAERVLVDLANELSNDLDITIFTIYGKGEFEKELSSKVKLVNMIEKRYDNLSKMQKIWMSFKLFFFKKSIYKKYVNNDYNVEIAFLEGPITRLFSVHNSNTKKIAWVHNDIGQVFGKNIKAKIKKILDKKCYSQYNNIVFVSNDNLEQFKKIYNLDNDKIVINNYISAKRVLDKATIQCDYLFDDKQIKFLTVARLTEQKAIDRLIKVHSQLINDGIFHKFYVIGDGPEKNKLEKIINDNHVKDTFVLLGKKENPYPYMKKCDIFALLSYYEGLPMTILEAKILNKPILITNTAAREAILGYNRAIITDNTEDGVYKGIKDCIDKLKEWSKAEKNWQYNNDYIIKQIEKLVK